MPASRTRQSLIYLAIAVAGACLIWVPAGLVLAHKNALGLDDPTRLVIRIVACTLAMAWATTFATVSFRYSDEFTQQGSMVAWYWGGAIGLALAAPIFVFIALGGLGMVLRAPALPAPAAIAATRLFTLGFCLPLFCQGAGFFVVRTWWRVSKR